MDHSIVAKGSLFGSIALAITIWAGFGSFAAIALGQESEVAEPEHQPLTSDLPIASVPDLREEDTKLKFQPKKERNLVLVPIPMSSPTFGTGLILGGAYFYPQTAEQKKSQPASFTGAAVGYTTNKSWFGGVMQQNYFAEDTWRFNAVAAYADFKLELIPPQDGSEEALLDWLVKGGLFQTIVSRRIGGHWFLGLTAHYLNIQQDLDLNSDYPDFNVDQNITSPGVGLKLDYDTRDMPMNAYSGQIFELKATTADQQQKRNGSYQSYYALFKSYHQLKDSLVLAGELSGCMKDGQIPLWDTCRLNLRGFPVTDYLSKRSFQAQVEARWRFYKRWGLVAFAGAGRVEDSFGNFGEGETIPSYGVGLRWMVLESQRINIRVDYGRSNNGNSAWYLSVTEAF
jgi:outer membrane protein assembly factor BamA